MLPDVINFVFKSKVRNCISFSKTSIYWTSKGAGRRCFTKETLVNDMPPLTYKCFMAIANFVFKQDIGIPMGIDLAPFGPISSFLVLN